MCSFWRLHGRIADVSSAAAPPVPVLGFVLEEIPSFAVLSLPALFAREGFTGQAPSRGNG
jgi:hypothetical protein